MQSPASSDAVPAIPRAESGNIGCPLPAGDEADDSRHGEGPLLPDMDLPVQEYHGAAHDAIRCPFCRSSRFRTREVWTLPRSPLQRLALRILTRTLVSSCQDCRKVLRI